MQCTQACNVQINAKCKIKQNTQLCKVENHALYNIMQDAKLWGPNVQDFNEK